MQSNETDTAGERAGARRRDGVPLLGILWLMAAVASACGPASASRSGVRLVVERMAAAVDGPAGAANRTFVESDVLTHGAVIQDTAQATLRIVAKDPGMGESPAAPSAALFATIDRYRVRYVRSDGRNVPGIDVPHPWDGALTLATSFDGRTSEFVLVRASAKLEPPLIALRQGGGEVVINTLAYVTFYGRDQSGARIEAAGAITIGFADWSDTDTARR